VKALSDAGFNTIGFNVQSKLGAQHIPKGADRRTLGSFWGGGLGVTDTVSRASAASGPLEVHTMDETTVNDRGNVPSDGGFNTKAPNVQGKLGAQHIPKRAGPETLGPFWGSGLGVTDTGSRASAASGPSEVHTMDETTADDRGTGPSDDRRDVLGGGR
jgi:hypothetical protein